MVSVVPRAGKHSLRKALHPTRLLAKVREVQQLLATLQSSIALARTGEPTAAPKPLHTETSFKPSTQTYMTHEKGIGRGSRADCPFLRKPQSCR